MKIVRLFLCLTKPLIWLLKQAVAEGVDHGQVGWVPRLACGRQVGGEESRPCNHIYMSRKPRPVPACRQTGAGSFIFPSLTEWLRGVKRWETSILDEELCQELGAQKNRTS